MKDTPAELDEAYRRMLLALSPADRLSMASRMFHTARCLMRAGMGALTETEARRAMVVRLYGGDLDGSILDEVLESLDGGAPGSPTAQRGPHL